MRLEVSPRTGSALEVGICAGDEINTDASTLTSDQTISSNNKLSISNAGVVNASSEAYKSISGSGYTPTPKVTGLMREMPVPATVLQYYTRQGTEIPITTLPAINHNELIANTKFEIDTSGWYPVNNSVLSRNTNLNNVKEGLASLKVSGRITAADAVATDLPVSILAPGRQFQLSFPVFTTVNANFTASMTVRTDAGEFSTSLGPTPVLKSIWGEVKGTVKPTWTGTPYQVTLTVMSSDVKKEYYLDKVSTTDITFPKGDYLLERHLISPTSNPFGATNPQGIYVINCAGKNLVITNSRIIGTIVLIKPGQDTEFAGSVLVEPAVANFPGILSDSTFKIALDPTPLSENSLMANFNPVGAPYPYLAGAGTTTNTTITDVYPSVINGLVYAGDDLNVSGDTRLNGLLVCQDKVQLKGGAMTIKYNSLYLNNPPPGFHLGTIEMKPVPGTWQRSAAP
jgi:hypothetical protein